jgi:hypothetical protein
MRYAQGRDALLYFSSIWGISMNGVTLLGIITPISPFFILYAYFVWRVLNFLERRWPSKPGTGVNQPAKHNAESDARVVGIALPAGLDRSQLISRPVRWKR